MRSWRWTVAISTLGLPRDGALPEDGGIGRRLRPFDAADAPALARILHAAVHGIASRYYTAEQLSAWSSAPADGSRWLERAMDGRRTWVLTNPADGPIAYADLERNGHIDHLYVHPYHAGTGASAELLQAIEEQAHRWGLLRLFVDASEPARRFFARHGFATECRNDFTLNGVAIHNFLMSKMLDPG